jgi:hypothetical protein
MSSITVEKEDAIVIRYVMIHYFIQPLEHNVLGDPSTLIAQKA